MLNYPESPLFESRRFGSCHPVVCIIVIDRHHCYPLLLLVAVEQSRVHHRSDVCRFRVLHLRGTFKDPLVV